MLIEIDHTWNVFDYLHDHYCLKGVLASGVLDTQPQVPRLTHAQLTPAAGFLLRQ